MRQKTKNIMLFTIMLMAITLSGCLNYEQEVSLYPDGSGTMKIHYWIKIQDTTKSVLINNIGLFNIDSVRSEFVSPYFTLENAEVFSDTTDSTTHTKIEISFSSIDSLNNTKQFSESNFLLQDGAEGQKIFSQFIAPVATGFGMNGEDFYVTYIYDFPGEIITHNATNVSEKKLIWKYSLEEIGKGKTISVTYRPYKLKETPNWILVLTGIVLLVVIFYLLKKKR